MKSFEEYFHLILFITIGLLMPTPAYATFSTSVPEPLSLMLLGVGLAGLGAAELIRRRKEK